ncbi:MAG: TIR domain-containing protein [Candidatus Thermoplasmatota archaeon]|jgi:hypothetical protein|nr:TIR domain-containing protein [Candidatus Thermoplasmatota archaeon]
MYNLLVASNDGAWELLAYEFDRSRFLEGTAESLRSRFAKLDTISIEDLKSFPTLFAYEGKDKVVHVGYIRRIRERAHSTLLVEFEFDEGIKPFNYSALKPLENRLDIDRWEMSRTHWAVKDEELIEALSSLGLVDPSYVDEGRPAGRVEEMRFKVALSFPDEKRKYVSTVASELKKRLGQGTVFYDKDFTAQLARPNMDLLLERIYRNNSDLVVVFLCSEYEKKDWCGLEWRSIRNIIKNKNDQALMFMRFDSAEVSGVLSIDGYVNLEEITPIDAVRLIVERVRANVF